MVILPHRGLLMGGAPLFLEYRSKADASIYSDQMTIPADVQPGDVLIGVRINDLGYGASTGTPVDAITGFTELASLNSDTTTDVWVGYKIAAPGDAGSTISEDFYTGSYNEMGLIMAFSTGKGAEAVTANDTASSESYPSTLETEPSTLGATLPVIVLGVLASSTLTPGTFDIESPAFDGEVVALSGGTGSIRVGYSIYNEGDTLADHSLSADASLYARTILTYLEVT